MSQHAGSAASPPNADCTHCSSLSSSGPRRLLLPPSGTLAEYWNFPGATHGHIRTAWAPDWSESTVSFFKTIFLLAAFINIIALPVTMSALVVFYFTSSRTGTGSFPTATLLPLIWLQSTSTYCLSEPVPVQTDTCLLFLSLKIPISSPAFQFDQVFRWTPLKQTQDVAEKNTCRVTTRRQCVCSI